MPVYQVNDLEIVNRLVFDQRVLDIAYGLQGFVERNDGLEADSDLQIPVVFVQFFQ